MAKSRARIFCANLPALREFIAPSSCLTVVRGADVCMLRTNVQVSAPSHLESRPTLTKVSTAGRFRDGPTMPREPRVPGQYRTVVVRVGAPATNEQSMTAVFFLLRIELKVALISRYGIPLLDI